MMRTMYVPLPKRCKVHMLAQCTQSYWHTVPYMYKHGTYRGPVEHGFSFVCLPPLNLANLDSTKRFNADIGRLHCINWIFR